jgi:small subunit ribosomal protein S6e
MLGQKDLNNLLKKLRLMILNVSRKDGKSYRIEIDGNALIGKKINEVINGDVIGLYGYEFLITGGSDTSGFPMRKEIEGSRKIRILVESKKDKIKRRKTVRGNTISIDTAQVNAIVIKEGKEPLEKFAKKKEKEKKEKKSGKQK